MQVQLYPLFFRIILGKNPLDLIDIGGFYHQFVFKGIDLGYPFHQQGGTVFDVRQRSIRFHAAKQFYRDGRHIVGEHHDDADFIPGFGFPVICLEHFAAKEATSPSLGNAADGQDGFRLDGSIRFAVNQFGCTDIELHFAGDDNMGGILVDHGGGAFFAQG